MLAKSFLAIEPELIGRIRPEYAGVQRVLIVSRAQPVKRGLHQGRLNIGANESMSIYLARDIKKGKAQPEDKKGPENGGPHGR